MPFDIDRIDHKIDRNGEGVEIEGNYFLTFNDGGTLAVEDFPNFKIVEMDYSLDTLKFKRTMFKYNPKQIVRYLKDLQGAIA